MSYEMQILARCIRKVQNQDQLNDEENRVLDSLANAPADPPLEPVADPVGRGLPGQPITGGVATSPESPSPTEQMRQSR